MTGRHTIEVLYANMEIMGSPFFPEVFDASLVTVEPIRDGIVGELTTFEGEKFISAGDNADKDDDSAAEW